MLNVQTNVCFGSSFQRSSIYPTSFNPDKTINVGLMWFKLCKKSPGIKKGSNLASELLAVSDFTPILVVGKLVGFDTFRRNQFELGTLTHQGGASRELFAINQLRVPAWHVSDGRWEDGFLMKKFGFLTQWLNNLEWWCYLFFTTKSLLMYNDGW